MRSYHVRIFLEVLCVGSPVKPGHWEFGAAGRLATPRVGP